ncbi:hydroxymethylglutaryl-CoA lyase [Clostridium carboxidivorans P7]|uniref:Pyruvate carboxyltransferase n=1 Tax=Clostridium carboxidivorans P7 TaxID=536227 RepID=C6PWR8_9CLOT|nr:hydroxymethylglutaryl-CoA lyase [Clostridium carboxidivorans]AKN31999.1 hydroxymethylglutaryl-CoA lyase [Clostridium carboxidivorans P7]EET86293.1 pyruvate carboxyltransferase [Clostridium carboxidivorans P7]EFG87865.1 HMGL-like protein [Clostridium carboxidivorans P7]
MKFGDRIKVVEVGPRDGLQNLKNWIPTEVKIKLIKDLIDAGIKEMEMTSFVHPKAIPQMKDAEAVTKAVIDELNEKEIRTFALVPNLVGAKKAYGCGLREITYVISASEKHNLANINRTVQQSLEGLADIRAELPDIQIRLDVATAFGCPFMGQVGEDLVINLIRSAEKIGINTITLCDTIGIANPKQVYELSQKVSKEFQNIPVGLHLHDTRGMGIANYLAAIEAGISVFETSIGGLGGCPFAPGAAGNTATEDLVNMLNEIKVETNIDLNALVSISKELEEKLDMNFTGHMVHVKSNCVGI